MKRIEVKEYQPVMRKLYNAAMKYPDNELANAIADVRDLVVEYKNIIDSVDSYVQSLTESSGDEE